MILCLLSWVLAVHLVTVELKLTGTLTPGQTTIFPFERFLPELLHPAEMIFEAGSGGTVTVFPSLVGESIYSMVVPTALTGTDVAILLVGPLAGDTSPFKTLPLAPIQTNAVSSISSTSAPTLTTTTPSQPNPDTTVFGTNSNPNSVTTSPSSQSTIIGSSISRPMSTGSSVLKLTSIGTSIFGSSQPTSIGTSTNSRPTSLGSSVLSTLTTSTTASPTPARSKASSANHSIITIGGVVGGVGLLFIIGAIVLCLRYRTRRAVSARPISGAINESEGHRNRSVSSFGVAESISHSGDEPKTLVDSSNTPETQAQENDNLLTPSYHVRRDQRTPSVFRTSINRDVGLYNGDSLESSEPDIWQNNRRVWQFKHQDSGFRNLPVTQDRSSDSKEVIELPPDYSST
ncbi:hypothetical protein GYMLUDRAFT_71020 [Collybiopsis luxurians FD-317 M1]|nr:hypothetical protein GYMLUDRAFT_71020 [Collybiopsis luxurians FD-317 M1]